MPCGVLTVPNCSLLRLCPAPRGPSIPQEILQKPSAKRPNGPSRISLGREEPDGAASRGRPLPVGRMPGVSPCTRSTQVYCVFGEAFGIAGVLPIGDPLMNLPGPRMPDTGHPAMDESEQDRVAPPDQARHLHRFAPQPFSVPCLRPPAVRTIRPKDHESTYRLEIP